MTLNKRTLPLLRRYILLRNKIEAKLRVLVLPGFDKVPLYDVLKFFFLGLFRGSLTTRAASIAFSFFLAIFPFILFLFTLIPFLPFDNFQASLFELMRQVIPENAFSLIETTIEDIISRPRSDLLSVGFIMALFFATNGLNSIMTGFDTSFHILPIHRQSFWQQRLYALLLLLVLSVLLITAIGLIAFGKYIIAYIFDLGMIASSFNLVLIKTLQWLVIITLTFLSISILYYLGPSQRRAFRFISAGSTLTTLLLISGFILFNLYFVNFSRYNALYGSIGSLIVFLIWLYYNAIILLIGFELNVAISEARENQDLTKVAERLGK